MTCTPQVLAIIAGKGTYPLELAASAKRQGVSRIVAVAFKKETDSGIESLVDEVHWVPLGRLQDVLDVLERCDAKCAVMAGQLSPTALFRVRLDGRALALLKRLRARNAETIFGAVGEELRQIGVELLPAHVFMESNMIAPGVLTSRKPNEQEQADIELGLNVAKTISGLNIGQTVIVKEGTVLAVEALEGTDEAIERAGRLGGEGCVIVKVAKAQQDMRFDIPVVGKHTVKMLKAIGASVLAVEARRCIFLDRDKVVGEANKLGIAIAAVEVLDSDE